MKLSVTAPGWTRLQLNRGRRRLHPLVWLQLFFGGRQAAAWSLAVVMLFVVSLLGSVDGVVALWSRPGDLVPVMVRDVETVSAHLEINNEQVYATTVAWTLDGQPREGVVYETGEPTWDGERRALVSRDVPWFVDVEGARTTKAPVGMSVMLLLLPLFALASAVWAWPTRLRAAMLLRSGVVTTATLVRSEQIGDGDHARMRCWFRFEVSGMPFDHEVTLSPNESLRVRDEAAEVIFHDRHDPQRAVLADSLPGEIVMGDGEWLIAPRSVLTLLIPPTLFSLVLVWALIP